MAGTMNSGMNVGLPKDHWIHKAMAKEKGRMAKKVGGPMREKETVVAPKKAKPQQDFRGMKENDNGDHEYR